MYRLSEAETEDVYARILQEGIADGQLALELLDHICCHMEIALTSGADIDTAYTQAITAVCPEGYRAIEEEVSFLLTYHKHVHMKRLLFALGFASTFLLSFGFLFKLMYWPGAHTMLLGGLAFLLLTLTSLAVFTFRVMGSLPAAHQLRMTAGLASGLLIVAGSICKIQHYPGAAVLLVSGMVLLNLLFLPLFFYQLYRKSVA